MDHFHCGIGSSSKRLYEDCGDVKIFAAAKNPELDVPKLTHFGCGVFFKAAVHPWHGDPGKPYIEMEQNEIEALRQYLLGKAPCRRQWRSVSRSILRLLCGRP